MFDSAIARHKIAPVHKCDYSPKYIRVVAQPYHSSRGRYKIDKYELKTN